MNRMCSYLPAVSRGQCFLHVSSWHRYDHSLPCAENGFNVRVWLSVRVLALNGQMSPMQALQAGLYTQGRWSQFTRQTTAQGLSSFAGTETKPFVRTLLQSGYKVSTAQSRKKDRLREHPIPPTSLPLCPAAVCPVSPSDAPASAAETLGSTAWLCPLCSAQRLPWNPYSSTPSKWAARCCSAAAEAEAVALVSPGWPCERSRFAPEVGGLAGLEQSLTTEQDLAAPATAHSWPNRS